MKTSTSYSSDCIAILAAGCVLPEADSVSSFWELLKKGEPAFAPLKSGRRGHSDSDFHAGWIRDEMLRKLCDERGVSAGDHTRTQLLGLLALGESLNALGTRRSRIFEHSRVFFSLGCMDQDEEAAAHIIAEEWSLLFPDRSRPPFLGAPRLSVEQATLMKKVVECFGSYVGVEPIGCIVDAACASSLAALDVGISFLRSGQADVVVSGGIEANLSPESFVPFEKLGVLSQGKSFPFDRRSDGLMQGEGAVIFVLKTLEAARRAGDPILAVISAYEALSNGSSAGVFAPSFEMQSRVIKKVNARFPSQPVHYFEAHGTGTQIGDETELNAIESSFLDSNICFPVGSTKALLGHTKGAAGAVGILKSILIQQHGEIPPSPYCESPREGFEKCRVNLKPEVLASDPVHCRVSGTGFGGVNYHFAIESHQKQRLTQESQAAATELCELGSARQLLGHEDWLFDYHALSVPPLIRKRMDGVQAAALISVATALERSLFPIGRVEREDIIVISAGHLGLPAMRDLCRHVHLARFLESEMENPPKWHAPLNEQCAGALNSLIPGRVSNLFDFRGKNFHVDAGSQSGAVARRFLQNELSSKAAKLGVLLEIEERIESAPPSVEPLGVLCTLLSTPQIAREQGWRFQELRS